MRVRTNAARSIATALGLVGMILIGCFPGGAGAKQTMIYHGNGFAIEPVNLYNWKYDGLLSGMSGGQSIAGPRGSETNRWPDGKMTWQRWGRNAAVGSGGLHTYCGTLDLKECTKSPWYGTPDVKVRAYARKRGHFTKIRVVTTGPGPKRTMLLKFIGKHRTPAWRVVREHTSSELNLPSRQSEVRR